MQEVRVRGGDNPQRGLQRRDVLLPLANLQVEGGAALAQLGPLRCELPTDTSLSLYRRTNLSGPAAKRGTNDAILKSAIACLLRKL